jgi:hypothetical protein
MANVVGDPHGAPKGLGIGGSQNVSQYFDAADQRLFQRFFFAGDELVLLDSIGERTREHLGLTGLGEEAKDISPV